MARCAIHSVEVLTSFCSRPHPQVGSAKAKPTIPADISPEAVSFLELTFELDHELRPSAADLLKHPWMPSQPGPFGQ